ncbi:MAG: putative glycoside hydrolase [Minisyncoccia bacterium]
MRNKLLKGGIVIAIVLLGILIVLLLKVFDVSHLSFIFNTEGQIVDLSEKQNLRLENPPKIIKGIYLTAYTAADQKRVKELIDLIKKTELNAVVIDIKDYSGYILFDTKSDYLKKFGTEKIIIKDLEGLIKQLHDEGIYTIARIAVFQDPILAKNRPDLAIKSKMTKTLWKDNKGLSWVDPASVEVWNYIFVISKAAMRLGFDELNFDYIRFPSDGNLHDLEFPFYDKQKPKNEIIKEFFSYLSQNIRPWGIKISADLFGLTTINNGDLGIGQILEDALPYFDYVCPMVYPSHYANGFNGYQNPGAYPYEVIKYSLDTALQKIENFKQKQLQNNATNVFLAQLRPWLQSFDLGALYDANMIKKEKKAVYDSLCPEEEIGESNCQFYNGWLLWDPKNLYIPQSLETK